MNSSYEAPEHQTKKATAQNKKNELNFSLYCSENHPLGTHGKVTDSNTSGSKLVIRKFKKLSPNANPFDFVHEDEMLGDFAMTWVNSAFYQQKHQGKGLPFSYS